MEKIDLILWFMGAGFSINFTFMLIMWNSLSSRMDKIDSRIDKLDEKITDIDRRICRLEGAFSAKECCVIKQDQDLRKAE